jgi:hypothetical protein
VIGENYRSWSMRLEVCLTADIGAKNKGKIYMINF